MQQFLQLLQGQYIVGDKMNIKLCKRFHECRQIEIATSSNVIPQIINVPFVGNGYYHEIVEVHTCLQKGLIESEKLPLATSLQLIQIIDAVKQQIGLQYSAASID